MQKGTNSKDCEGSFFSSGIGTRLVITINYNIRWYEEKILQKNITKTESLWIAAYIGFLTDLKLYALSGNDIVNNMMLFLLPK